MSESVLVPIRLDITIGDRVLSDTFTWPLHERESIASFARTLCADLELDAAFENLIVGSITQQLDGFRTLPPGLFEGEIRRVIKLDLHVGNARIQDQFEWEMNDPANLRSMPEEVARNICTDLGIGPEYAPMLSHAIREQILAHTTQILEAVVRGTVESLPVVQPGNLMRSTSTSEQDPTDPQWAPQIVALTEDDMEKLQASRSRELRAQRRGLGNTWLSPGPAASRSRPGQH
eukprot:TRINITY_DN6370_c0_g1_i1.p1 TRINITY_DN6370_c0_g1~~TRINITY_DN6370_c0_g1_i1.p1  ORF type:complete len:233 (+),score=48.76 TRINITY_DN6370_c0_g1_i1:3-701(+)